MTDLSCTDYSDKAIVVRGDTKEHKEELKNLGGKYNANLRDGPGWIFSKKNEDKVQAYIASGTLEEKPVSKHTAKPVSKFLVKESTYLLSLVEEGMKSMDLKERLTFIADVTCLASSKPIVSSKASLPVPKVQVTLKKRISSSDEEEPDSGSDDDMSLPSKRLLRPE